MKESEVRGKVVKILRKRCGIAVENPAKPGTPDVAYIGGWIEIKTVSKFPVRLKTQVSLDHPYTRNQYEWARKYSKFGGNVFILVKAEKQFFLFPAPYDFEGKSRLDWEFDALQVFSGWKELEEDLIDAVEFFGR